MNCGYYRRLFEFSRPGVTEIEPGEIAALENHLATCEDCRQLSQHERRTDELLATAFRDVPSNPGLRERIVRRTIAHRNAWWRLQSIRAAIVGLSLVAGWQFIPAPYLDADALAWNSQDQFGNQLGVQEWLARQNSNFTFPPQFRSKYLVSYERRSIYGVSAPVLTFVKRNSLARVLVLTPGQFRNLASLPDGRIAENSVSTLLVMRNDESPGVIYLVEVLNGPIEPFGLDDEPSVG